MSTEFEKSPTREILEKAILESYAQEVGIPFDLLHDQLVVDPFVTFYDDHLVDRQEQMYFAMITGMYSEMPGSDLEEEALEFVNQLWYRKNLLMNNPEVMADDEGMQILVGMNPDSLSNFAAWFHGRVLGEAIREFIGGELNEPLVTKLVFWSKVDRITREGMRLLASDEMDSNLDLV